MELLLLSNSTLPGKAWLEHALPLIANQLNGRRSAVFIPFAGVTQTWDEYTDKTAEVLAPLGINVTGIHRVADPLAAIEKAEIIIVGGGNTFQLLKESRERGLLAPMADRVKRGALYIGWSAGANLACPTIRTTNDMPIVDPNGFDALICSRCKLILTSLTPCRKVIRARPASSVFANCWWSRRN